MRNDPLANFYSEIHLDCANAYRTQIDSVFKKLEDYYYSEDRGESHGLVVGSLGRGTAVAGASDVDLLFDLPKEVYRQYDSYEENGQSALLQNVKRVLKEHYPHTNIKGDGQAVVIEFGSLAISIDLVPAFQQKDGSYKYPDTHNGGSWKKTDPVPEQEACTALFEETCDEALHLCNALRVWKDNIGISFKGLLIDTLVSKYFEKEVRATPCNFDDHYEMLTDLFGFLADEDRDKSYWHALGSNQQIPNDDGGVFVLKAGRTQEDLLAAETREDKEDVLIGLFGKRFSDLVGGKSSERTLARMYGAATSEEFVEEKFVLDIRYSLNIDCEVTQDGFRTGLLRDMLRRKKLLPVRKSLDFFVTGCNVPEPYEVFWKVRNVGEVAYRRNEIRGQIVRDGGKRKHHERTLFRGPHFVECYAVKNGVCVARARIEVPIEEDGRVL